MGESQPEPIFYMYLFMLLGHISLPLKHGLHGQTSFDFSVVIIHIDSSVDLAVSSSQWIQMYPSKSKHKFYILNLICNHYYTFENHLELIFF